MELDLRQWLLFLGPVFIAAILLHGYWRMRHNRGHLKMALDEAFLSRPGEDTDLNDLSWVKAELPNGGARIIKAEQPALELSQDVPVLMEQVQAEALEEQKQSPVEIEQSKIKQSDIEQLKIEQSDIEQSDIEHSESLVMSADEPVHGIEEVEPETTRAKSGTEKAPPARKTDVPEKFIVITVMADDGFFNGQELLEALVDLEMIYGEMNIFHRLSEDGFSAFSLANAVEPGTFDISAMDKLQTPGVTLFMRVHELAEPLHAYDAMMSVAMGLTEELGGMIRDESRSVMTAQTIEHCRQEIRDFQFRHSA